MPWLILLCLCLKVTTHKFHHNRSYLAMHTAAPGFCVPVTHFLLRPKWGNPKSKASCQWVVKQVVLQRLMLAHYPSAVALPGGLRTYHNLKNAWYFPHLWAACEFLRQCRVCQRRKGPMGWACMQGRTPPDDPLEVVSADLMDIRGSSRGFLYGLSVVDYHS